MERKRQEFIVSKLNTVSRMVILNKKQEALELLERVIRYQRYLANRNNGMTELRHELEKVTEFVSLYNAGSSNKVRCDLFCSAPQDMELVVGHIVRQAERALFDVMDEGKKYILYLSNQLKISIRVDME